MKPAPFRYARPKSVAEALELLSSLDDAKILAGGQSLVPMMNFRMAQPEALIDINRIAELSYIERDGDELAIGALTRHCEIRDSQIVRDAHPLLALGYHHVAHETVRNRGTIGGNLAHADPASEIPAVLLLLNARIILQSVRGKRIVDAADFFIGALAPDLEPDELLVEVRIPEVGIAAGIGFEEYALRKGDLALAGAGVLLRAGGNKCTDARIAMFGLGDRPLRFPEAEALLMNSTITDAALDEARDAVIASVSFEEGPGITAEYRRDLAAALLRRALEAAWREARTID